MKYLITSVRTEDTMEAPIGVPIIMEGRIVDTWVADIGCVFEGEREITPNGDFIIEKIAA